MESTLAIVIAAMAIGLVKGGIGGSLAGAIVLPLLTQRMSVAGAVGVAMPLLIMGDLFAMRVYWREWEVRYLRLLLPGAIVGIVIGTVLLVSLPDLVLRRILGVTTIVAVIYKLASDSMPNLNYRPRDWHGRLAGMAAGLASTLANLGGPPITAWLLLQRSQPATFVGTITFFFFFVNLAKLPGYFATGVVDLPLIAGLAWALPLVPPFVWLGRRVINRVDRILFERVMLALLALAGLSLLISGPVT
ncbi:MAG: sulfite exporter TauE/SafE family protein [Anaerolineaceae bacterium]|nr:sulfite exporter TauE/SafE family protein [Anaerolineaceae bacterium]